MSEIRIPSGNRRLRLAPLCRQRRPRPDRRLRSQLRRAPGLPPAGLATGETPAAEGTGTTVRGRAANLRAFEGSTLIFESGADEVVPHAIIDKYRTAAPTSKHVVIPGATHVLDREEWRVAFINEILDWFKDL